MRIRLDKWLVVLVVLALSTLSWWMPLELDTGPVATLVTGLEKRHIPDFYLEGFDLTAMNEVGRPRYQLQGRGLSHYADDDTAQVTQPMLTVYRLGAAPWLLRAEQALVAAAGESVLLQDQVKIERLTEIKGDKLEIQTPSLRVLPDKEYAETDQPVAIISELGVTRAIGMEADLRQGQLRLLAQVRGEYAQQ